MRLFFELSKLHFRQQMAYRASTFSNLSVNFFFGLMRIAVLVALYGQQESVEGMDLIGVVTYLALSQSLLTFVTIFGSNELANSIYSGEIATQLLKPMHYFNYAMAQDMGRSIFNLIFRGILLFIIYDIFFEVDYPPNSVTWLAFFVSIWLAWLISFAYRFLANLSSFWTPNARGILRFLFVIGWFFSGFLMPLRLFPDWLQRIAAVTPFPSMLDTPVEIYMGLRSPNEILQSLLIQCFWVIILVALAQFVLKRGTRRLVILGG